MVAIVGPTAVGKTAVAVEVSGLANGEIVTADSMQLYRGLNIGTAKPDQLERKGIPHHLIDVFDPAEPVSVAEYQKRARREIDAIQSRNKLPLLVGGSGLYIRAVVDDLKFPSGDIQSSVRQSLERRLETDEPESLHEDLKRLDPAAAKHIHPKNARRVIRALEVIEETGRPFSEYRRRWHERKSLYPLLMFGLTMERKCLYAKINQRVEAQLERGLLDEVKQLVDQGYENFLTSSQALGYKEFIGYFNGRIDLDEAVDLVKRRTRQLAKRQLTWFKADPRVRWIDVTDKCVSEAAAEIHRALVESEFADREV